MRKARPYLAVISQWTRAVSVVGVRANVVGARPAKSRYSAC